MERRRPQPRAPSACIKGRVFAQNFGMIKRVGAHDPEGVRTRDERETFVKTFSASQERNERGGD